MPIDARTHLEALLGRPTVVGATTLTVISVGETTARVLTHATAAPVGNTADTEIPLEWVQLGIERLEAGAEIRAPEGVFGRVADVVFGLLVGLPGAEQTIDPPGVAIPTRITWNLAPGAVIDKTKLVERFGGHTHARISGSADSPNVFIFASLGEEAFARWDGDVLEVPGDKIRGSRLTESNKAVLGHEDDGRTLRVFWRSGASLLYAGEFAFDSRLSFDITATVERSDIVERRIVFRLRPVGAFLRAPGATLEGVGADASAEDSAALLALPAGPPTEAAIAGTLTGPEGSSSASPVSSRRPHVPEQLWDDVLAGSELVARGLRALGARGAWPPVLIASALAVALTTWAWTALPLRPAVTTWFLLVCPGMALVRLLPPRDRLLSLVLAAALSLTLETLLAEMTLLAGVWSPGALLTLLIVVTVAASVMDLPSVRHHVESAAATGWSRIAVRESTEDGAT